MQKKTDGFSDFSIQDAAKIAQSDAGQQLLSLLQSTQGSTLQSAMDQAAAGNYDQLRKTVQEMMRSKQAQDLLSKMRGSSDG